MSFSRFTQRVSEEVAKAWFFYLVLAAIVVWLPTLALWDTGPSDLLVDALTNPLSLILLVLLHNSQTRQQNAQDRRQDVLEESLAVLLAELARTRDGEQRQRMERAADRLVRDARQSTRMATAGEQE